MKEDNWWDYFDEDPFEPVGRQIEGMFGETITVTINRLDWAYLDWLEKKRGGKIKEFFKYVESVRRPSDGERDEVVAWGVRQVYLRFEQEGKPRPPWCAAANPDDFDELENLEKRE